MYNIMIIKSENMRKFRANTGSYKYHVKMHACYGIAGRPVTGRGGL
jgi:hypothetical protein